MNSDRGFTLLELLISITMLALIAGILGWALNMAYRTVEKGERKIQYLEREKTVFSLLESQILALFPYQYSDEEEKKIYFSGEKDKLIFASNYSLWRGTRGNVFVAYEVQTNEKGKKLLQLTEQVIGLKTKDETILLDDCDSINFEYFLKNALEEGNWIEEWSADEKGLPYKIKIIIVRNSKATSLIMNPPLKANMTLKSSASIK